ncbi:SseB family protein [Halovulum sp. GXIMD14793]
MTPLDQAMAARDGSEAAEMAFYAALQTAEMFLVLEEEPEADTIRPLLLQTGEAEVALVFDQAERLAAFLGQPGAFVCLAGRQVTTMLAGQRLALGVNLGTAQETLLSSEEIDWLAGLTPPEAEITKDLPGTIRPPQGVSEAALASLDTRLAQYGGPGRGAWLVDAVRGGQGSPLVVIAGLPPEAEAGLAAALTEAAQFAGLEMLELAFVAADAPVLERLKATGLQFDMDLQDGPQHRDGPPKLI